MEKNITDINSYLESFPIEIQNKLNLIRNKVKLMAPDAMERMCMGLITFDLKGKWFVHCGTFKKHIGFYPQPSAIEAFKDKLKDYKTTKGTIQFPNDVELPLNLIEEIIEYSLEESKNIPETGAKKKTTRK